MIKKLFLGHNNLSLKTLPLLLLLFADLGCITSKIIVKDYNEKAAYNEQLSKEQIHHRLILPAKTSKNVIYLMIAKDDPQDWHYDINKYQMDAAKIFKNKKNITDEEFFTYLMQIEVKARTMIKNNTNFPRAVLYVGQAKDFLARTKQHKNDFSNELKQLQSNKVRWVHQVLKNHYVEINYLVKNIPKKHLNTLECLIGHLFSVQDFKGSAKLGTTKSWQELQDYFQWPKRTEELTKLNLLDSMEKDREKLRELILPFMNPWANLSLQISKMWQS